MSDQATIERLFMLFHGYWGNHALDRFAIGRTDESGADIGLVNAKRQWGRELAEFDGNTLYAAAKRARDAGLKFAPSLPEFIGYCRAIRPRVPETHRIEHAKAPADSTQVLAARNAIRDFLGDLKTITAATDCPLIGLIAAAVGLAGGDEVGALRELEANIGRRA